MVKRNNSRRKKRINIKKVLIAFIILTLIGFGIYKTLDFTTKAIIFNDYYISSDINQVTLYQYDEE